MISNLRYNKKDKNWITAVLFKMEFGFAYFQPQLMLGNAKHDIKAIMAKLITAIYIYYLIYTTNISSSQG